jgi:hypothetical protein
VKERRLRNICSMEAANGFLPDFIETHNKRFAVPPRDPAPAHRPWTDTTEALGELLARQRASRQTTMRARDTTWPIAPASFGGPLQL